MVHSLIYCYQFSCHYWWDVDFDRFSRDTCNRCSSQSFPNESTAGVSWRSMTVTNNSNCLTYNVASSLVCTSPLAVITVVGLLNVVMVSNSAKVKVFLTDHMHTRPGINHKLSLLRRFCWRSRKYPLFCRREECSLLVRFEVVYFVGKIPSLALGTSLLSFSLFVGPILEFYSVGTSLMRNFDTCFPNDGPFFFFPDTRMTECRLSESYPLNWFQDILHRVSPRLSTLRNECIWILRYTTQLWYTFFTIATTFLSSLSLLFGMLFFWLFSFLFSCSSTLQCGNRHLSPAVQLVSFLKKWHSGGCQYSQGVRVQVTFQIISTRLSKNGPMVTFASDTSLPPHTSTSWKGWLGRCGGSVFWFLRTILGIVAETATVSMRTLAFFFPLVTDTLSSFITNDSLSTFYHGSRFNSPMPGIKVS